MAKTRKEDLRRTVVWKNKRYGPGKGVEVPEDFPADISKRMAEAGRSRVRTAVGIQSPPGASGSEEELTEENSGLTEAGTPKSSEVGTGAGAQEQFSKEQLEGMDKAALDQMAQQRGVTVKGTGENGAILKKDLVAALTAK